MLKEVKEEQEKKEEKEASKSSRWLDGLASADPRHPPTHPPTVWSPISQFSQSGVFDLFHQLINN